MQRKKKADRRKNNPDSDKSDENDDEFISLSFQKTINWIFLYHKTQKRCVNTITKNVGMSLFFTELYAEHTWY